MIMKMVLCQEKVPVLLERILANKYSNELVFKFFKEFEIVKTENKYINIISRTSFIDYLKDETNLPITHYLLTEE